MKENNREFLSNIKLYINTLESRNYAISTTKNYDIHLRHFYSFCNKEKIKYKEITYKQLIKYRNYLFENYSKQSINPKISVIKNFYNFLIEIEETDKNLVLDSLYIREKRIKPKPLSLEEQKAFFEFLKDKKSDIQLAFLILFQTGIRVAELTKLKKNSLTKINNRYFLTIESVKNSNERLVPIFSLDLLQKIKEHIKNSIYADYLFDYSIRAFQNYADEFEKKTNIKFTVHQARHTFATEKLNQGLRIDVLQKILGHSDIRTTMYYAKTDKEEILKLGVEDIET